MIHQCTSALCAGAAGSFDLGGPVAAIWGLTFAAADRPETRYQQDDTTYPDLPG